MPIEIDRDRRQFVRSAAMTLAAAVGFSASGACSEGTPAASAAGSRAAPLPIEGDFPSLGGATAWLNSPALTPKGLRGTVVLVDFCTYTCINWLRSLPYVRGWAEKYHDQGLLVIGIHTPEFPFEHDLANVRRALQAMRVPYPVAIDNNYAVWQAFDNHYWPALYLVDAKGRIRYHHFGEGEYDEAEMNIQQLLTDAGARGLGRDLGSIDARGAEVAADWANLMSAENYLGHERTEGFASPGGAEVAKPRVYSVPPKLSLNHWALAGDWTVGKGAVHLNQANGRIAYRFHARDLHLVMGPAAIPAAAAGSAVAAPRFRVLIDGQPPGAAHGFDVDEHGQGTAPEQRLYQLVRQPHPIVDRQFEIEFLDPGVEAFSFTFG